jgi:hypothetical protein
MRIDRLNDLRHELLEAHADHVGDSGCRHCPAIDKTEHVVDVVVEAVAKLIDQLDARIAELLPWARGGAAWATADPDHRWHRTTVSTDPDTGVQQDRPGARELLARIAAGEFSTDQPATDLPDRNVPTPRDDANAVQADDELSFIDRPWGPREKQIALAKLFELWDDFAETTTPVQSAFALGAFANAFFHARRDQEFEWAVDAIRDILHIRIVDDTEVTAWLETPEADLGGRIPLNAIAQGDADAVKVIARRWAARLEGER